MSRETSRDESKEEGKHYKQTSDTPVRNKEVNTHRGRQVEKLK
jgi:hypothetical protein